MSSTNPYGQNLSSPPAVDGNYYSRPTAPPSPDGRPAPPSRLNISIPDNDVPRPHGRPSIPNKNSSYKSTGGLSKAGGGGGGHVGFEGGPDASVEQLPYGFAETTQAGGSGADVRRKKSLVRPERERHNPNDRLAHYRQHAANMESNGQGRIGVIPSGTGNVPNPNRLPLRRGKSILAREEDQVQESGLALFKRNTVRRKNTSGGDEATRPAAAKKTRKEKEMEKDPMDRGFWGGIAPGPVDGWMIYCFLLTCWVPGFILRNVFGKRNPEAQRAWREKMGLVGVIALVMLFVGYLTFGFTITVCGTPPNRYHSGSVQTGSLIINGLAYDLGDWNHPATGVFNGTTNPLYMDDWKAGGMDASFMFQKVNDNCLGLITPAPDTAIQHTGQEMAWYFPCNLRSQNGSSPDLTNITSPYTCHTEPSAREQYSQLKASGEVYFDWKDIRDPSRNLAVYQGTVLDLNLLQWLSTTQTEYPQLYTQMMNGNASFQGLDITMLTARMGYEREMACLMDTVTVGFISAKTIGCIASDIVLYTSLIFIIGIVAIKFAMAVTFGWFLSWRLGSFKGETYAQRMARAEAIENWTDDIYRSAPSRYRPNVPAGGKGGKNRGAVFLPTTSRFSKADSMMVTSSRPSTTYGGGGFGRSQTTSTFGGKGLLSASPLGAAYGNTPPGSPMVHSSQSSNSLPWGQDDSTNDHSYSDPSLSACPFPLNNVIPQPPPDYEPFNFPLMHNILLVTAYSESIEGLRTTIDSLATTDYPNSHKVILVIADGMVRGSGSKLRTPDIVLGMMKEFVIPPEEVEAHSYVAIADGHKKHNMAKVYAGFYEYDDDTVEVSKQQRVPMILVAKTGNPLEVHEAKPGNRGKRDSQIIIMGFLQKVMFDERMTTFEYEFFNSLWRCTGVSPDQYVGMLCVDADTKVFPDSLTRMTAAMHHDPEIMGLCGETKIANKTETWVTMIQVFEYYISHHQTKAFEAVFGGVTCLPGCFSMYRIKAPKGDTGYWVPIIANPDIVEHYSENVVDTLHKKNLLLLGEDRYLSTLMLKTFPKRKMMFIPQAVCKTVVPDTFKILLSQRRRWINSTIHNLFELLFVRDLCGTFCFSMQFVVLVDLVGTLALPAAITFTLYIVIISIIPSQPTPTMSLILLALILGLPALLIVITSRKIAYVGWMLIYLCSLPIWNFVLPVYAYWHFDDFSWGETRKIEGEGTGKPETGHGDKEGVFDSTSIVMKRWAEFERERRWRSGTQSRDSNYDLAQRSTSPRRRDNRYSLSSTFDAHSSAAHSSAEGPFANPRPSQQSFVGGSSMPNRADSVPLLALPAPLGPRVYSQDSSAGTSDEDNNTYRHGASSSESGPFGDSNYADSSSRPEMSPVVGRGGPGGQSFNSIGSRDSPSTSTYDEDSRSSRLSHGQGVDLVDQGYLPPSQPAKVGRVARNAQRRSGSIVTGQSSPMGTASSRGGMGGGPASPTSPRYSQQPGGYARFDRSQQ